MECKLVIFLDSLLTFRCWRSLSAGMPLPGKSTVCWPFVPHLMLPLDFVSVLEAALEAVWEEKKKKKKEKRC